MRSPAGLNTCTPSRPGPAQPELVQMLPSMSARNPSDTAGRMSTNSRPPRTESPSTSNTRMWALPSGSWLVAVSLM